MALAHILGHGDKEFFDSLPGSYQGGHVMYLGIRSIDSTQQQRIKSEYILDNLKNLKLDTLQLFSNIQRLNKDKLNPTYIQIENDGLRLRYRVLEIESILGENQYTKEFQNNLTILLNNLQSSPDKRYIYLSNFVVSSRNLSIYLSKVANIADEDIKFYKIEKLEAK